MMPSVNFPYACLSGPKSPTTPNGCNEMYEIYADIQRGIIAFSVEFVKIPHILTAGMAIKNKQPLRTS